MSKNKIIMEITHVDGDRKIVLGAKDMKELIDDKLPMWLPKLEEDLPSLKNTNRFKKNPEKEELEERESGWYYDC
jgi:hypothetical protein